MKKRSLLMLLCVLLCACSTPLYVPNGAEQPTSTPFETPAPTPTPIPTPEPTETPTPTPVPTISMTDGQVFPDSSSRLLSDAEVDALTQEQTQYAINEIWARNGYTFSDAGWYAYYSQFDWYHPSISKDEWYATGTGNILNSTENANEAKLEKHRSSF